METAEHVRERVSCCFYLFDYPVFSFLVFLSDLIKDEMKMPNISDTISKYSFQPITARANHRVITQFKLFIVFIFLHRSFNGLRRPFQIPAISFSPLFCLGKDHLLTQKSGIGVYFYYSIN